jgi:hypothetical protein
MRQITLALLVAAACGGAAPNPFIPRDAAKAAERKLNSAEKDLLDKQGFAILDSSPTTSFHVGYTALFE